MPISTRTIPNLPVAALTGISPDVVLSLTAAFALPGCFVSLVGSARLAAVFALATAPALPDVLPLEAFASFLEGGGGGGGSSAVFAASACATRVDLRAIVVGSGDDAQKIERWRGGRLTIDRVRKIKSPL